MIDIRRRCMEEMNKASYLPIEYQQVEYLESRPIHMSAPPSDSAYINTNYFPNQYTRMEIDYIFSGYWTTDTQSRENQIGGGANESKFILGYSNGFFLYGLNTIQVQTQYEINLGDRYSMILDANELFASINETQFALNKKNEASNLPLLIFARSITPNNFKGVFTNAGSVCYYCKISERNVVLREFIPCYRRADNVPGMYDIINNKFYTNAGTGSFIVGPDIN